MNQGNEPDQNGRYGTRMAGGPLQGDPGDPESAAYLSGQTAATEEAPEKLTAVPAPEGPPARRTPNEILLAMMESVLLRTGSVPCGERETEKSDNGCGDGDECFRNQAESACGGAEDIPADRESRGECFRDQAESADGGAVDVPAEDMKETGLDSGRQEADRVEE